MPRACRRSRPRRRVQRDYLVVAVGSGTDGVVAPTGTGAVIVDGDEVAVGAAPDVVVDGSGLRGVEERGDVERSGAAVVVDALTVVVVVGAVVIAGAVVAPRPAGRTAAGRTRM